MTSLVAPLEFHDRATIKNIRKIQRNNNNNIRLSSNHILKSNCLFKRKCDKALKRKLLKYKLKRDEDQEVIDVSHILLSTLKIKSPSKLIKSPLKSEEIRPRNYLFKMARGRPKKKPVNNDEITNDDKPVDNVAQLHERQEKKQTNAFMVMMNSRNKSIGSNSPGKEINIDPSELEERMEKKTMKAKRNLALQKMAEAKGSLKRQEMNELEEECIKQKMEMRKKRLKEMIVHNNKEPKKNKVNIEVNNITNKPLLQVVEIDDSNSEDKKNKIPGQLKLVDIFHDIVKPSSKVNPSVPKEDEEFLKKLSPSIKKKENMLSYFKKIDKNPENLDDTENVAEDINDSPIIKVKVSHKMKKKVKSKKLSLNKNNIDSTDILKDHNENDSQSSKVEKSNKISKNSVSEKTNEQDRKKRKHIESFTDDKIPPCDRNEMNVDAVRPKRNVKRPMKYTDDVQLSSSDEELYVFTSKKRKQNDAKKCTRKDKSDEVVILDTEIENKDSSKVKKINEKENKLKQKPSKLAPIFTPKSSLNPEQIEAKQRFLYSGVPDQIKKIIAQQKSFNAEVTNLFPVVVHVQQKDFTDGISSNISNYVPENDLKDENDPLIQDLKFNFSTMVSLSATDRSITNLTQAKNTTTVLQNIKETYPKFPVYRTFRLLKTRSKGEFQECDLENSVEEMKNITDDSNENPNSLIWTDKYKAASTKNVIGNFESINELKTWLLSWTENEARIKKMSHESDSSDFYDSDSNSRDYMRSVNNLLILNGPVGSGKTSIVYAVAAELAIKVIEVNASSKRTGKVMLQDLQEATQSHKVTRGTSDNSQKSQEIVENTSTATKKKKGRPKKIKDRIVESKKEEISNSASQENNRTGMSLILVDDADIVFEQDDGFASAISQLAQSSKRPVILVTGSLNCPHLQKFVLHGKIINMKPLPPRTLGTWLDIMCLADNGICWPGLGGKILNYHKGDIRKSINYLQFYMTASSHGGLQGEAANIQNGDSKPEIDDESSNMSWTDNEASDVAYQKVDVSNDVWKYFMHNNIDLMSLNYPKDLLNVWWSLPNLFCETLNNHQVPTCTVPEPTKGRQSEQIEELDAIANVMDNLSLSDYFSRKQPDTTCNITSQPWYTSLCDSVSEQENFEDYSRHHETTSAILHELVNGSITNAQKCFELEKCTTIQIPSMAAQREKDKIISCHNNLTNILNPSAALDRRALSLDYWSACRSICRIEKNRTDTTLKRNNRFYHYLKSLNVAGRNDSYDRLGDSLCFKGE